MASNTSPNFTKQANIGSVLVTAANTSSAGGGTVATDIFLLLTADATNGSFVEFVRWIAVATAPTTMTATTLRIFHSTVGAGGTTSANTRLIAEVTGPAIAADSATVGVYSIDIPLNIRMPAGTFLLVSNHAAPAANSNWRAIAFAGDF